MINAPPASPLRVPNKHDFNGHDSVVAALATAFVRPTSPERVRHHSGVDEREDFSSSNSAVTADMLRGRIGGTGGEMMKWRLQAAEDKKHRRGPNSSSAAPRLPRLRGGTGRGSRSMAGLRARVLHQLKPKKYGYVPQGSPAHPPTQWYEYAGSRSSVPKLRHLDPEKLSGFRNDGWKDDAMSDNLSVVGDDVNDLETFLNKGRDPADVWVDRELGCYAADLQAKRRQERLDPRDKTTGAPKIAGVTETIVFMKTKSRQASNSVFGKMLRL